MAHRLLEHVTDAIVEVDSGSLDGAFAEAATALAEITLDTSSVEEREERVVVASGRDVRHALLDWLEAANLAIITGGFAARRFGARVEGRGPCEVRGTAHGEALDTARHGFRVEVKAPTLHMMEVSESPGRVRLRFLLDL
ncbi:MAG: archease [Thaumarchaeota archaeon]|nr:archease [Nitrososphaerota archaeon]